MSILPYPTRPVYLPVGIPTFERIETDQIGFEGERQAIEALDESLSVCPYAPPRRHVSRPACHVSLSLLSLFNFPVTDFQINLCNELLWTLHGEVLLIVNGKLFCVIC